MPHLSPLNWMLMTALLSIIPLSFMTTTWWQTTPAINTQLSTSAAQNTWNWQ